MTPFMAVFNSHLRAKTLFPVIAEADAEQKRVGHIEGLPWDCWLFLTWPELPPWQSAQESVSHTPVACGLRAPT